MCDNNGMLRWACDCMLRCVLCGIALCIVMHCRQRMTDVGDLN